MSTSPINGLSVSYLQSASSSALKSAGVNIADLSQVSPQSDTSQLSPFAQLMSTLQQLQQSDPAKYQQVTQQIATNLQDAAQTAQSQGNTASANQLSQLSNDFSTASKSGQLPNVQDLANAVQGGHGHHHHHAHASGDSDGDSASSSSSSSNQTLTQFLASLQSNGSQNSASDPMSIILNTLSSAGVTETNQ